MGYLNGNQVFSTTVTVTIPTSGKLWIGSNNGSSTLAGSLYSVRVYSRVLSAQERLDNYNLDVARFGG